MAFPNFIHGTWCLWDPQGPLVLYRFSKVAGEKLMDNNADIADLSDPNRAMKLGDRFGQVYDDTWTDSFEILTDKLKMSKQSAIMFLLDLLQVTHVYYYLFLNTLYAHWKNIKTWKHNTCNKFLTLFIIQYCKIPPFNIIMSEKILTFTCVKGDLDLFMKIKMFLKIFWLLSIFWPIGQYNVFPNKIGRHIVLSSVVCLSVRLSVCLSVTLSCLLYIFWTPGRIFK